MRYSEEYLVNMLIICHRAMTEEDAHVGLLEEQWLELSEITGIPHPVKRVFEPYEPDEAEILKNEFY